MSSARLCASAFVVAVALFLYADFAFAADENAASSRKCEEAQRKAAQGEGVSRKCEEEGTVFAVRSIPGAVTEGITGPSSVSLSIAECNAVSRTGSGYCLVIWRGPDDQVRRMNIPVGGDAGDVSVAGEASGRSSIPDVVTQMETDQRRQLLQQYEASPEIRGYSPQALDQIARAYDEEAQQRQELARRLVPGTESMNGQEYTVEQLRAIAQDSMDPRQVAAEEAARQLELAETSRVARANLLDTFTLNARESWADPDRAPLPNQVGPDVAQRWAQPNLSFPQRGDVNLPESSWQWPSWGQIGSWAQSGWQSFNYFGSNFNCLTRRFAGSPQQGDSC